MIDEPVPTMPLMVPATSPTAGTKRKSKGLVSGKPGGALIRRGPAGCRHFEAESHGGREVDHQLEFGRMLHGDGFARLSILQAAIGRVAYFVASSLISSRTFAIGAVA